MTLKQPAARAGCRAAATPYLYLLPLLLTLGLFTYWPLLDTLWLSLTRWNLNPGMPVRFEGSANYVRLANSTLFHDAARNTLYYILASIPLKVLLPLPFAVAIWALGRAGNIYRTILFLPTLISFVAISMVFLWLLNPLGGLLPQAMRALGLSAANPLADPSSAFWTIMAISSWKVLGFNVLGDGLSFVRLALEMVRDGDGKAIDFLNPAVAGKGKSSKAVGGEKPLRVTKIVKGIEGVTGALYLGYSLFSAHVRALAAQNVLLGCAGSKGP